MSKNIVESLPKRKFAPTKAVTGKKGSKRGSVEEGSEKRIKQAVYDIRYRARREDIDLKAAFSQYMGNSSLSQKEKTTVRAKLFGKDGVKEAYTIGTEDWAFDGVNDALYKVFVESDKNDGEIELAYLNQLDEEPERKYQVRVKDKNGRAYVRLADRKKITQLRGNPDITSVEMTDHGEPYEGKRKKPGKLDPVGKEDSDIDNDGDVDKSDKYLHKRRKAIGNAIKDRAVKKIEEKVNNYNKSEGKKVVVNPDDGAPENKSSKLYAHREVDGKVISEELPVPKHVERLKQRKEAAASAPSQEADPEDPRLQKVNRNIEYIKAKLEFNKLKGFETEAEKQAAERSQGSTPSKPQPSPTSESKPKPKPKATPPKAPADGSKLTIEAKINTPECEKKPEKEKDMRGTYAKLNLIKNKLRSMGQKDPCVMLDDVKEDATSIKRSGTSTNAAGEKIDWKTSTDKNTGKTTVTDKYGTRDSTAREATPREPELRRPIERRGPAEPKGPGPRRNRPYPGYNPQHSVGPEYRQ